MKQNEKFQSLAGYHAGRSVWDKPSRFPRGFVCFRTMKKSIKPQNETSLEAVVTARAKREAQRHGVALSTYVSHLAAKADRMPVTVQVKMADIGRINSLIGGGRIHEWIEGVVADVLECEMEELEENRVTIDLEPKTAEKLRKAAEFEELSVEEYLMDGLKRDLDLSQDLMAANGGAR